MGSGILGRFQRASFDFMAFACSSFSVRGGARIHQHEYRHTPGAVIEKLGRKLYVVDYAAYFSDQTRGYPDAFPNTFSDLLDRFDRLVTSDLVVPILGTIQAMCIDWPIDVDYARMRDGVRCKLSFLEDSRNALIVNNVVQLSPTIMAVSADLVVSAAEAAELDPEPFRTLTDLADEIDAMAQQIENVAQEYIDSLTQMIASCQQLEARIVELQYPENWEVSKSLRALGVQAINNRDNALRKSKTVITYTVTQTMNIVELAILLYDDSARATEIMQLNALEDPMEIRVNTKLRVYAPEN